MLPGLRGWGTGRLRAPGSSKNCPEKKGAVWAGSCQKHPDAHPFQPGAVAKLLGAASAGQRSEPGEAGLALEEMLVSGEGCWGEGTV